jgi:transcriptional regulator with XRE-family HTH domain
VTFRQLLESEFLRRACRNPRYSLRAFAHHLHVDASTLSRWLRGRRPLTPRAIEQTGWRLGFLPRELRAHFPPDTLDATSRRLLAIVGTDGFTTDSRWLASRLDVTPDEINIALQRLMRRGLLQMCGDRRWRVTT